MRKSQISKAHLPLSLSQTLLTGFILIVSVNGFTADKKRATGFEVDGGSAPPVKSKQKPLLIQQIDRGSTFDLTRFFKNNANHKDFQVDKDIGPCHLKGTGEGPNIKNQPMLYNVKNATDVTGKRTKLQLVPIQNENISLILSCPTNMNVDQLKQHGIDSNTINIIQANPNPQSRDGNP